ncbi:MAG: hypothetical protein CO113_02145 [Elusimicrobia bacterium CG_4_9_14_3_um_filter_62_55]|nr:MAG: hypothetical protein COR54_06825 [Elusimicrobia bacterium CG22_combo_CG10-13_8_21_14_all_63_91]PJA11802.1 MAG: hypothetical protein COX66_18875 [Elusimicrobia bacterium CG_4_10_14_0_2_um_filter_63_34]PJB26721.1 MAG: hypothetical protein CO113_02145 [Elusimicrobia bacterium CG_4_9_14_3_um_filter_62_55]
MRRAAWFFSLLLLHGTGTPVWAALARVPLSHAGTAPPSLTVPIAALNAPTLAPGPLAAPSISGLLPLPAASLLPIAPMPTARPAAISGLRLAPAAFKNPQAPRALGQKRTGTQSPREGAKPRLDSAAKSAAAALAAPGRAGEHWRKLDFSLPAADAPLDPVFSDAPRRRGVRFSSLAAAGEASSGRAPAVPPSPIGAFLGGTFASQVGNNALHVALPIALLGAGAAFSTVAVVIALAGAADAAGTLIGGWLADRVHSKHLLTAAAAARAAALFALPALLAADSLTLPVAAGVVLADALARGIADTARHALPLSLTGSERDALDAFNSRYQTFFEGGALIGPFAVGGMMLMTGTTGALWFVPAAFALSSAAFALIPNRPMAPRAVGPDANGAAPLIGVVETVRALLRDPKTSLAFLAAVSLTLYPLRSVLPAAYAESLLHDSTSAAWLVGMFGLGGLVGAALYRRFHRRAPPGLWLGVSSAGTLGLALAWAPASLPLLATAIFLFAAANVTARLFALSTLQSRAPPGAAGRVLGATRFSVNLSAMGVKALVGAAFAAAVGAHAAFVWIGAGLAAAAVVQALLAYRAGKTASAPPRLNAADAQASPDNLFDKDPEGDSERLRANYRKKRRGLEFYFRNAFFPMQKRFAQLFELDAMPRVFLHGNPHLDNYAKTHHGAAMVDFDRSRVGPYAWDLLRFLVSLSISQKRPGSELLPEATLAALREGYLAGFRRPEKGYREMKKLRKTKPTREERSTRAYVEGGLKWVEEMRARPLAVDDARVAALLAGYAANRGEPELLEDFFIAEAGLGVGSMGERERIVLLLKPRDAHSRADWILLDLKENRNDPDDRWFATPFPSDGERMLRASELYAPGWADGPGWTLYEGKVWSGRRIPTQNAKLKRALGAKELADLAGAVGSQLGRGHRLSLQSAAPDFLEAHLRDHWDELVASAAAIKRELTAAHRRYLRKLSSEEKTDD